MAVSPDSPQASGEVLAIAAARLEAGRRTAAATLIAAEGSAPFDVGATMIVGEDGAIEGSITGGCVEAAVAQRCSGVLAGDPPGVVTYGVSDEAAGEVGLTCGGTVHVLVCELESDAAGALREVLDRTAGGQGVALAQLVNGGRAGALMAVTADATVGSLHGGERLDDAVARDARGSIEQDLSGIRRYGGDGETLGTDVAAHIQAFSSAPRIVAVGAVDFSVAVARLAGQLGYRVTVCDPRTPFLRSSRLAVAHELVGDWPDRYLASQSLGPRDAVLVFSHDPKFDVPALMAALDTGAGYIGALGSRRTHEERTDRLRAAGAGDDELARIASPCGLDLGGRTPEETALSVLAEVVAVRHGRPGGPLAGSAQPIHGERVPAR